MAAPTITLPLDPNQIPETVQRLRDVIEQADKDLRLAQSVLTVVQDQCTHKWRWNLHACTVCGYDPS